MRLIGYVDEDGYPRIRAYLNVVRRFELKVGANFVILEK